MNAVQRIDAAIAERGGEGLKFTAALMARWLSQQTGLRVHREDASTALQQYVQTKGTLYTLDCVGFGTAAEWVARPAEEWAATTANAAQKVERRIRNDLDRRVRPLVFEAFEEIDAASGQFDDLNAAVDLMLEEVERILRRNG